VLLVAPPSPAIASAMPVRPDPDPSQRIRTGAGPGSIAALSIRTRTTWDAASWQAIATLEGYAQGVGWRGRAAGAQSQQGGKPRLAPSPARCAGRRRPIGTVLWGDPKDARNRLRRPRRRDCREGRGDKAGQPQLGRYSQHRRQSGRRKWRE